MIRLPFFSKKHLDRSVVRQLMRGVKGRSCNTGRLFLEQLEHRVLLSFSAPVIYPTGNNPAATSSDSI